MHQVVLIPADASELFGGLRGKRGAVISTGIIRDAAIQVNSDGFHLSGVVLEHFEKEKAFFHLESSGERRGFSENVWVLPRHSDAEDASHGGAKKPGVRGIFFRAVLGIQFRLKL